MKPIKRVTLISGGVIGAGWAARLIINGIDVTVCDPSPRVETRLNQVVDTAIHAYRKMTLAPVSRAGSLTFVSDIKAAVTNADFIQESGPERLDLKRELLTQVCNHTAADVVVASSSSGLLPSEMQAGVRHPERVLVGHPFNPVYLMPLVEIVGGSETSTAARTTAAEFYRSIGMHPLQVRKEIDAFLADRMMEALWREALHLVRDGVATIDEIDQAICYGPGLRWAFMGSFMVYRVAGGEGGFRHFMQQFGPSLKWPWTRFDGPELTEEFLDQLTTQSDQQAAGKTIPELEQLRDDCLVKIMQALATNDHAAGKTLNRYQEKLYALHHPATAADTAIDITQPLALHQDRVHPDWVDYNNHMTESRYLQAFGDASDALFRFIGIDAAYRAAGSSYYTVETHLNFLREAAVNTRFYITTQLLAGDPKRIHLFHSMHATDHTPLATTEQLLLHINTKTTRTAPATDAVLARLNPILKAHANLPPPPQAGRYVSTSKPPSA